MSNSLKLNFGYFSGVILCIGWFAVQLSGEDAESISV